MQVPFLDLKAQYQSIREEVAEALQAVLDKTAFAGGPFVNEFENAFAEFCQAKHAIGVSNGTEALWVALKALNIGPGDEVITTANTFIATAEAISMAGATPVFIDADPITYTLDPKLLEAAITENTKAVIPVHLYGQMAEMDPIMEIAKAHGLYVVEDASQAHGAEYKGKRAGSIGDIGCFSFYPGKNLGAYGEAGGITTNNDELAQYMRMFRDHGQSQKYYHDIVGWNGRMDGFQGAILSVKLKHLDAWTDARRAHAQSYCELLADVDGVMLPVEAEWAKHVYHIFHIRVQNRDAVMAKLNEQGIACGIHYPIPLHMQKAYADMPYSEGQFPVSEQSAAEMVSLPMFAELTEEQIQAVCAAVKSALA